MYKIIDTKHYINEDKKVVTTVIKDEMCNTFRGQAYCSDEDTFDINFGSKLSYLRAKRKMLKYYNSNDILYLKETEKHYNEYKNRALKNITKTKEIINRVSATIDNMLDN